MDSIETINDDFWSDAIDRFQPVDLLPTWRPTKAEPPQVVSARFRPRVSRVKSVWFSPTETGKPANDSDQNNSDLFDPYADQEPPVDELQPANETAESTCLLYTSPSPRDRG